MSVACHLQETSMRVLSFALIALGLALVAAPASTADAPHLRTEGDATQLIVDGQPFLILGGELGNSTASDPDFLKPLWPKLTGMGVNTLFVPVEWDQIEPVQGQFDFHVIDAVIAQARENDTRLVLLWFGAWKNSMSIYAPAWIKRNSTTFGLARDKAGVAQNILSSFDADNLKADTAAFVALVTHLKATDSDHTVIMVQVENEIGMLPVVRDYSPAANAAFARQVPPALTAWLKAHKGRLDPKLDAQWAAGGYRSKGTWAEVFGDSEATEEIFQAWGYATFVEAETRAGKAAYNLPMFVNAALNRPDKRPGEYPSAGPLPHLFDIWKACAPSIDILAMDHYWADFGDWAGRFKRYDNPLLIPEANQAGFHQAPGNAFFAFGELDAISFSPFSIENLPAGDPLIKTYAVLRSLTPVILAHQGKGDMRGFRAPVSLDGKVDETPQTFDLGGYRFSASMIYPWMAKDKQDVAAHGGLIIQTGQDEFIVAGTGITLTFKDPNGRDQIGIEQIVEGLMEDGKFIEGRWLNGDQSHQGRHLTIPDGETSVLRLRLYRYK
jgi:beta-galactosidase GanA